MSCSRSTKESCSTRNSTIPTLDRSPRISLVAAKLRFWNYRMIHLLLKEGTLHGIIRIGTPFSRYPASTHASPFADSSASTTKDGIKNTTPPLLEIQCLEQKIIAVKSYSKPSSVSRESDRPKKRPRPPTPLHNRRLRRRPTAHPKSAARRRLGQRPWSRPPTMRKESSVCRTP